MHGWQLTGAIGSLFCTFPINPAVAGYPDSFGATRSGQRLIPENNYWYEENDI